MCSNDSSSSILENRSLAGWGVFLSATRKYFLSMNFNRGDWQGRSKRQVENNYKITFYSIFIGIIVLIIVSIYENI